MHPELKAYLDDYHARTMARYDAVDKQYALMLKILTGASPPQPACPMGTTADDGVIDDSSVPAVIPDVFSANTQAQEPPAVTHDASSVFIEMVPVTCSTECQTQVVTIGSVDEVHNAATTVRFEPTVDLFHLGVEQLMHVPSIGTNTSTAEAVTSVEEFHDTTTTVHCKFAVDPRKVELRPLPWPSFSSSCRAVQVWSELPQSVPEQDKLQIMSMSVQWHFLSQEKFKGSGRFDSEFRPEQVADVSKTRIQLAELISLEYCSFKCGPNCILFVLCRKYKCLLLLVGIQHMILVHLYFLHKMTSTEALEKGDRQHLISTKACNLLLGKGYRNWPIIRGEISSRMLQSLGIQCVKPTSCVPVYLKLDAAYASVVHRCEQRTSQDWGLLLSSNQRPPGVFFGLMVSLCTPAIERQFLAVSQEVSESTGSLSLETSQSETHIMNIPVQWGFLNQEKFRVSGRFASECHYEKCDNLWTFPPCLMIQPIYCWELISMDGPFICLPGTQLLPWYSLVQVTSRATHAGCWTYLDFSNIGLMISESAQTEQVNSYIVQSLKSVNYCEVHALFREPWNTHHSNFYWVALVDLVQWHNVLLATFTVIESWQYMADDPLSLLWPPKSREDLSMTELKRICCSGTFTTQACCLADLAFSTIRLMEYQKVCIYRRIWDPGWRFCCISILGTACEAGLSGWDLALLKLLAVHTLQITVQSCDSKSGPLASAVLLFGHTKSMIQPSTSCEQWDPGGL